MLGVGPYSRHLFYTYRVGLGCEPGVGRKEVQREARFRDIPAWARDNLVLKFLDDNGFRLRVVCDEKYLSGLCERPLIVIRSRRRGHEARRKRG